MVMKKLICDHGHVFYKSSDCRSCPECEKLKKPPSGFMSGLSAPARRALINAGITSVKLLSKMSVDELLQLHGLGPSSIPKLRSALLKENLDFKTKN